MALDVATLTTTLTTIFSDISGTDTAAQKAQKVANAIDIFVKTATVTTTVAVASVSLVTPGVGVSGPGAGTGTGTLS